MSKQPLPLYEFDYKQHRVNLYSPTQLAQAGGFLWNKSMMMQVNCRGFTVSQFMQPEPCKYSFAPNIEAKTFMQPEHAYYANHPGRFFYIKDEDSNEIFSAPFEPVKSELDHYQMSIGQSDITWHIKKLNLVIDIQLTLAAEQAIEMWQITVKSLDDEPRNLSIYPYFTIGYMSWMNQSATFDTELNGIVASFISPYQKVDEYFKNKHLCEKTFLLADQAPCSWLANQHAMEGFSGLHHPQALQEDLLAKVDAQYETPAALLQYKRTLQLGQKSTFKFVFGPAKNNEQITEIKQTFFDDEDGFEDQIKRYKSYISQGSGNLKIHSQDPIFDEFVNTWLPRQMFYHGDVNRLTTDPQTRNYLQDNLGMSYINSSVTRQAFICAFGQQSSNGAMPDGILIHPEASLKYINEIPHADHGVWLSICLQAYLSETNDIELLNEMVGFADSEQQASVLEHIERALAWLYEARDHRGLSYIEQGDWCDPMNMVGYKGKGVSTWLSLATAYSLNVWADICLLYSVGNESLARQQAKQINASVNEHCWDGNWYARGITDDNQLFGIKSDVEGRIFLNPQSWSILSGAADHAKINIMLPQIKQQLQTPYGVMMLAPSYTKMRDDIGRVTQKFPGSAENGSVYNHAAIFYAYSLYQAQKGDEAFEVLRDMLADQNIEQRGQLPVFIPNYYRGAFHQYPSRAGRSSQLFNTGTVSWFYRCLVEGLAGLKGEKGALIINPQLPSHWQSIQVIRNFLGARFNVDINRSKELTTMKIILDGIEQTSNRIDQFQAGENYQLRIWLPKHAD